MHTINLPGWVEQRRRLMPAVDKLEPRATALLVIDLQCYFVEPGSPVTVPTAIDTIPNVNLLATALRRQGGQIVWLRHTFSDRQPFAPPAWFEGPDTGYVRASREHLTPGSPAHELHKALVPSGDDWVINKHRFSAFLRNSSDLDARLQARGIDTVVVTGTLTNCCCESTARDALMLDYRVLFASDATAALTDEEHNASLLNLAMTFVDVRPTQEILDLVEGKSPLAKGSELVEVDAPAGP
jgi:ureidoacrylate peracid hydrolase